MKTRGFILGVLIILLTISFISAETSKVGDAQNCLKSKVDEATCSKLTTEEQAFSLLAVSKCKKELKDSSKDSMCWPTPLCKTKTTAQAILALEEQGENTDSAVAWLLGKAKAPTELNWYLQIESTEPTTCQIFYASQTHKTDIGQDKKVKSDAGRCLTRSIDGYWLKVKPNCYKEEFEVSCNERFSTSLIYKKKTSSTVYVSGGLNTASAEGKTKEKVDSFCFKPGDQDICDYEATLWTAIALNQKGVSANPYLPYLVSMANENDKHLPESFLYKLTSNEGYYKDLASKQVSGYWEDSGNKFYDTAVALYSIQGKTTTEKTDAITWLLSVQDSEGCWRGISETGFLLYAGWQEGSTPPEPTPIDLDSCNELKGKVCSYSEECDGDEIASSDGDCCLGKCEKTQPSPDPDPEPGKEIDYLPLLLTLGILIILTVIGFIFKDKLRVYWFRLKSMFKRGGTSTPSEATPPGLLPPGNPQQQPTRPRRILPRQPSRPRPKVQRKPKGADKEFSDVLKKLKDIGS